jgi:hypothetical protein
VKFYLADFRDSDNNNDYIVDEWTMVDLTVLDTVDMIEMILTSSDAGEYGMNTPAYFCVDQLGGADFEDFGFISGDYWNGNSALSGNYRSVFATGPVQFPNNYSINDYGTGPIESWTGFAFSSMMDSITAGYDNQYSAVTASGVNSSSNYGVCYTFGRDTVYLTEEGTITGMFVTNGTLGVESMLNGDGFAKKFGGESGNDPDWFMLTVRGLIGGTCTDTVNFYLADYRFENNQEDYILTDWEWIDLTSLGTIDRMEFSLSSSDTGPYGMNTPAFFFMDDINDQLPVVISEIPDTTVDMAMLISELTIDLSEVFSDQDDEDLNLAIESISNMDIFSEATLSGNELALSLSLIPEGGEADICIKAVSGGHSVSDCFHVEVIPGEDGLNHVPEEFACSIFPNPTHGTLTIRTNVKGENKMQLIDLSGHLLLDETFYGSMYEFDFS